MKLLRSTLSTNCSTFLAFLKCQIDGLQVCLVSRSVLSELDVPGSIPLFVYFPQRIDFKTSIQYGFSLSKQEASQHPQKLISNARKCTEVKKYHGDSAWRWLCFSQWGSSNSSPRKNSFRSIRALKFMINLDSLSLEVGYNFIYHLFSLSRADALYRLCDGHKDFDSASLEISSSASLMLHTGLCLISLFSPDVISSISLSFYYHLKYDRTQILPPFLASPLNTSTV